MVCELFLTVCVTSGKQREAIVAYTRVQPIQKHSFLSFFFLFFYLTFFFIISFFFSSIAYICTLNEENETTHQNWTIELQLNQRKNKRHVAVPSMVDVTKLNHFTFFRFFLHQNHSFFLVHTHSAPFYMHMYINLYWATWKNEEQKKNVSAEKKILFFSLLWFDGDRWTELRE